MFATRCYWHSDGDESKRDVNALLDKGGVSGLSQIGSFRAKFGLC